jgi:rare lipoprotein A
MMNKKNITSYLTLLLFLLLTSCAKLNSQEADYASSKKNSKSAYTIFGKTYNVAKSSKNYEEKGIASWYGRKFHKKRTSSGEKYNMYSMTAAHKTLPFATRLLVTNVKNGRQAIVRVNDRGPFVGNRFIDLSYAAAKKIGIVGQGLANVHVKALDNKA